MGDCYLFNIQKKYILVCLQNKQVHILRFWIMTNMLNINALY